MSSSFCPNCGIKIKTNDTEICPKCGIPIGSKSRQTPPPPSPSDSSFQSPPLNDKINVTEEKGKKRNWIYLVIVLLVLFVIAAFVIASFVFGMTGNISKTKMVAFTVQKTDSTHIRVANMGGQDAGSLATAITTTTPKGTCSPEVMGTSGTAMPVGTTSVCTGYYSGKTQVIVVGHFTDGSVQVLIDTTV